MTEGATALPTNSQAPSIEDATLAPHEKVGLLIENLAGVGVALAGGALAALVAAVVVLPVLPLFDQPSEYVAVSALPDLGIGGWTLLAVAVALSALAIVVAAGQLKGGTVDRIGEGTR